MITDLLKQHIEKKGRPETLVFFRNGVSEGMYGDVLHEEYNAIKLACALISRDYKPLVTLIMVNKRHHLSFFPKDDKGTLYLSLLLISVNCS
jgi:eukaryotic translation initiation factor 2C